MMKAHSKIAFSSLAAVAAILSQPALAADDCTRVPEAPTLTDFPTLAPTTPKDPAMEQRIARIVAGMTLRQKIGQMTQPEIQAITPAQVREHYIGSVLNGGGSWPGNKKQATVAEWLALADAFWDASMSTDAKVKVPVIWGIDAVHGNNNVIGATLFPHNIGLGAAHDACLLHRIGQATAKQVRTTGQDWTFAPTLAVVRDDRWGRSYEGYAELPSITRAYAREIVLGLQGTPQGASAKVPGVLATAKHFLGDGGTERGIDQGITRVSRAELANIHAPGHIAAVQAGVQTVMVSFSSWADGAGGKPVKMHGNESLINGVLKGRFGFDGLVVSDWNGHGQVPGCDDASCAAAVNAGIDVFMVPQKWRQFIDNTVAQVEKGAIPMSRIDDAVTRILRVKMRAGLFDAPKPSQRAGAGKADGLQDKELARQAVRESLVLLKNNGRVLPLARDKKVLVVGRSADNLPNQTGGWSITWQGNENTNADFPNATSVLAGIKHALGDDKVVYDLSGRGIDVSQFGAVIAVIGESAYAEGKGDVPTLANPFESDLSLLKRISGKGVPVVTVLMSGRPLYVTPEINRSDAFIAAWLPGTEGQGIADLLFRKADGSVAHDFTGRLSYSWPKNACQTPVNAGDGKAPLFAYGYGLSIKDAKDLALLDEVAAPASCD